MELSPDNVNRKAMMMMMMMMFMIMIIHDMPNITFIIYPYVG
jgi:hypothetical protein